MMPSASGEHIAVPADEVRSPGEVVVGRFRVGKLIGAGAMGAVYEGEHLAIGRRVAIKFLRPSYARNDAMRARFRLEAQAAGRLQSEHVTDVIDFGFADDGAPFIVLELLEGESLARRLRSGPVPAACAVDWLIQASRGVAAAHRGGVIHRDLKPANIFICAPNDGKAAVKVLDFGVAKLVGDIEAGTDLTATGMNPGTPLYMAPEQARGARDIDARADVFALGLILYEALSGRRARGGHSYNEVVYRILHQPATPLHELCPELPRALTDVVQKAMAFEPRDRYASASALADALAAIADNVAAPATPKEANAAEETEPTRAQREKSNSHRKWLRAAVALAVVVGGGGGAAAVIAVADGAPPEPQPLMATERDRAAPATPAPQQARQPEQPPQPEAPVTPQAEGTSSQAPPSKAGHPGSGPRKQPKRLAAPAPTQPSHTSSGGTNEIRQLPLEVDNPYDP